MRPGTVTDAVAQGYGWEDLAVLFRLPREVARRLVLGQGGAR